MSNFHYKRDVVETPKMSDKQIKEVSYVSCCNCGLEITPKEFVEYNNKHKYDPNECPTCKGQIFELYTKP